MCGPELTLVKVCKQKYCAVNFGLSDLAFIHLLCSAIHHVQYIWSGVVAFAKINGTKSPSYALVK